MKVALRLAMLVAAIVAAVSAYPAQREILGVVPDARVAQMQIAHVVMLITVVCMAPRAKWHGFVLGSTLALLALVAVPMSHPLLFISAALGGTIGYRLTRESEVA